eukprot:TRINITY_DN5754_c0_g1_i2.p2 TRINITY_DN5754_c0_g1~~TRINITY_DN5754_c0_g1_i2.p2  ORF type:complete len:121 (+),score=17.46 TRINITY_DN5754_c0_g1_i2:180-542(+)
MRDIDAYQHNTWDLLIRACSVWNSEGRAESNLDLLPGNTDTVPHNNIILLIVCLRREFDGVTLGPRRCRVEIDIVSFHFELELQLSLSLIEETFDGRRVSLRVHLQINSVTGIKPKKRAA